MLFDRLTIEFDGDDGWVSFRREGVEPEGFHLPRGFGLDDVRRAALATGWVHQRGDELHVDVARLRDLAAFVPAILEYFASSGVPLKRLLAVREAATDWIGDGACAADIPLEAFAWLDLAIREDAADNARCAVDLWENDSLQVSLDAIRRRHVDDLLRRYEPEPADSDLHGKMATSSRTRRPSQGAVRGA
jgi:hypothetical protein